MRIMNLYRLSQKRVPQQLDTSGKTSELEPLGASAALDAFTSTM